MSTAQVFIDHLTLPVRDLEASRRFYRKSLAPFGVEEVEAWEGSVGDFLRAGVDFYIRQGKPAATSTWPSPLRTGRRSMPSTRRR